MKAIKVMTLGASCLPPGGAKCLGQFGINYVQVKMKMCHPASSLSLADCRCARY